VFVENVFPFSTLHPNVSARLKQDILLLPSTTPFSQTDDANYDDHVVPIVPCTNVLQDGETTGENKTENGAATNSESEENQSSSHAAEENETSTEHEEEHSSAPPDPEASDPTVNPLPSPVASRTAPTRSASMRAPEENLALSPSASRSVPRTCTSPMTVTPAASPTHATPATRRPPLDSLGTGGSSAPDDSAEDSTSSSSSDDSASPSPVKNSAPPAPPSPIRTRLHIGIKNPKNYTDGIILYDLLSSTGEPYTLREALVDENWRKAMEEEYTALMENKTWHLVPLSRNKNLTDCKWVYRIKRKSRWYN
jgi:hypothetical protein